MQSQRLLVVATIAVCLSGPRVAAQAGAKPVAVIGGEQDTRDLLENPSQIGIIGSRILVLDANEPYLKLFDLRGNVVQRLVRKGNGPGEISAARRFTYDSLSHRVYTWDVLNLRANIYRLGDTLQFETSYRTNAVMSDACFLGRRLFALGLWRGRLVHELEVRNGELQTIQSLGVPRANHPLDGNPNFQFQVAIGRIACDEARQQVIVVSAYVGVAQLIDVRTGAQRTVRLDSLLTLTFHEQQMGTQVGISQFAPNGIFDNVVRADPVNGSIRLLVDRLGKEHRGPEGFDSVTEWFLSSDGVARKGVTTRQRELGRSGDSIVCYLDLPVPTVSVYKAARCP